MPTCRVGPWYFPLFPSLRGRRLKGKGKGDLGARETREAQNEATLLIKAMFVKVVTREIFKPYSW